MKLSALVVDDSKVMRGLVMKTLTKTKLAEWKFTEAGDGEQALGKFGPGDFDIVFADWNMPKMSGLALAKEIRKTKKGASIPIIMVTSEKSLGKIEIALDQAKANAYVTKPFTVEEFKKKIEKIIAAMGNKKGGQSGGFFKKLLT